MGLEYVGEVMSNEKTLLLGPALPAGFFGGAHVRPRWRFDVLSFRRLFANFQKQNPWRTLIAMAMKAKIAANKNASDIRNQKAYQ